MFVARPALDLLRSEGQVIPMAARSPQEQRSQVASTAHAMRTPPGVVEWGTGSSADGSEHGNDVPSSHLNAASGRTRRGKVSTADALAPPPHFGLTHGSYLVVLLDLALAGRCPRKT